MSTPVMAAYQGTPEVDDTAAPPPPAPSVADLVDDQPLLSAVAALAGGGAPEAQPAAGVVLPAAEAEAVAEAQGRRPRVILAVSGSVATIKVALLAEALLAFCGGVKVVATASARHFFSEEQLPAACRPTYGDEEEWREWRAVGDPVLHIELRRWADALVVAPLSANTLAKAAGGLCDNLLTCIIRAWDFGKPMLVAPAMNTYMWESPFTEAHLATLRGLGVAVVAPAANKRLACGDVGAGAMAAPDDVAAAVRDSLAAAGFDV